MAQTVLVVEDDPALAQTYDHWLSDLDETTAIVEQQGSEALQHDLDAIDVIALDRGLPDIPGSNLLDRLDPDVPVIVISAYNPDSQLSRDDVEAYLTKPIEKADFFDAFETVLSSAE